MKIVVQTKENQNNQLNQFKITVQTFLFDFTALFAIVKKIRIHSDCYIIRSSHNRF